MNLKTIIVGAYALLYNKTPSNDLAEVSKLRSLILGIINDIKIYQEYYIQMVLSKQENIPE